MKDKYGKEITRQEFKERFKQGIQDITPYQQTKISMMGSIIVLVGVFAGLYATFINQVWWLFTILIGSLFLTSVTFLGILQKYLALKKIYGGIENFEQESTT
jgi:hypothetical protein